MRSAMHSDNSNLDKVQLTEHHLFFNFIKRDDALPTQRRHGSGRRFLIGTSLAVEETFIKVSFLFERFT